MDVIYARLQYTLRKILTKSQTSEMPNKNDATCNGKIIKSYD